MFFQLNLFFFWAENYEGLINSLAHKEKHFKENIMRQRKYNVQKDSREWQALAATTDLLAFKMHWRDGSLYWQSNFIKRREVTL